MRVYFKLLGLGLALLNILGIASTSKAADVQQPVYVIPIRDDIEQSIVYVVRRGLKEAIENNAQAIILDVNTNGGRGDSMEEIMNLLQNFKGETITYVNTKAYSAGAFIAVATKHIYMAPASVIGAAAPIMMSPTGDAQELPSTIQKKISSAFAARIRAAAERNGHNPAIVDAMVKETDGLTIDHKTVVKKGEILTLTDTEATTLYGKPPKPLLAEGIAINMEDLFKKFGYSEKQIHRIEPTGAERLARWITMISPLLLLIGIAGIYLEFKTPGINIFGIIGVVSLAIFFFGHYVAGLSGFEEVLLFIFGLILIGVELFLFPGHVLPGFIGVVAILTSLVWAMVDKSAGTATLPSMPQLQLPLAKLGGSMIGAAVLIALLTRWLPNAKGSYGGLILQRELNKSAGYATSENYSDLIGQKGKTLSILRPSGTARLGEKVVDVIAEGEFISADQDIIVKEVRGAQVIVQKL